MWCTSGVFFKYILTPANLIRLSEIFPTNCFVLIEIKMVEQQRRRVEDNMTRIVEEIDKSYLRKMQADMHRCAVNCCENKSLSLQRVQQCIETCSISLNNAQQYVQSEFERSQNRLQRCIMECNDSIKDKMSPDPTQDEVNKLSEDFEKCATKCVDSYCELLPTLEKTIIKVLSSGKFDQHQ